MGAYAYWYVVPAAQGVVRALQYLREREFNAGRYYPVVESVRCDDLEAQASMSPHSSIDDARRAAGEIGTRSILDIEVVCDAPRVGGARALDADTCVELFGSKQPRRELVESRRSNLFEEIERGECVFVTMFEDERPIAILFAGYSYD